MIISLRDPKPEDMFTLVSIQTSHGAGFNPDEYFSFSELTDIAEAGNMQVVDDCGYAVGGLFIKGYEPGGIHCEVIGFWRPAYYFPIYRTGMIRQFINRVFARSEIIKIKAHAWGFQRGLRTLLKKHLRFRESGILKDEAIIRGQLQDLHLFELKREYWGWWQENKL